MPLAGEIAETEAAFARGQQSASHG
jgi:hypothetical protein